MTFRASRTVALFALVGKAWCDDVSLIQDMRSKLSIQRPGQHSSAGLIEVATNMLKHGSGGTAADEFVGNITHDIMGDLDCDVTTGTFDNCGPGSADSCVVGGVCTPGVLAHIKHAHDVDQKRIITEHALFNTYLSELAEINKAIALLRDDDTKLSNDHLKCRHDADNVDTCDREDGTNCDEKKFCDLKVNCDTQLYKYWLEWHQCETLLAEHHLTFHKYFCDLVEPGTANSTNPEWRITSVGYMSSWMMQEEKCRSHQSTYEEHVTVCQVDYTNLVNRGGECDAKQVLLQQKSCEYAQKVKKEVDEFMKKWNAQDAHYGWYEGEHTQPSPPVRPGGVVHVVKLEEYDRVSEWTTLDVVRCLMDAVREKNGQPCDDTTDEAKVTVGRCQNRRFTTDVTHLNITYPEPPPLPKLCSLVGLQGPRYIYPVDDPNVEVCLPVEPPRPCTPAYNLQEFAFGSLGPLPTFPASPFTYENPACNPQPECDPKHTCVIVDDPLQD